MTEDAKTDTEEAPEETQIDALVNSNLRGIGDVRLRKHSDADLRRLLCRMTDTEAEAAEVLTTDALVEALLAEKKRVEKQKKGKKKMKQLGRVSIPQDAFLNYFSSGE